MTLAFGGVEQVLSRESDQIAARIGGDPTQTRQAISLALPVLLAGLQQEATTPGTGLQQAVQQDHDGSILDDIAGYLNGTSTVGPRTTNGNGILEHVLGARQPEVRQALSSPTGLSMSSIAQLLPLLAPIVMGMLGRQSRSQTGGGDLGSILGGMLGGSSGSVSGGLGDLLKSVLGGRSR